jgi:hypothetical protein
MSSLDLQVDRLLKDIEESKRDLTSDDLLKAKAAFLINKIGIAVKLTRQLERFYEYQDNIDNKLLEIKPEELSVRELLVMNGIVTKKIDSNYNRINSILAGLKINEIENILMILANLDSKKQAAIGASESGENRLLAIDLLKHFTEMQNAKDPKSVHPLVDELKSANSIMNGIDSVDDPEGLERDLLKSTLNLDQEPLTLDHDGVHFNIDDEM